MFTLSPSQAGGRRALKGFDFQATYIAYVLAGYAAGKEDFFSCRVEAVEDLDVLVRVVDTWIERYFQIKTKREGGGQWGLNALDREGVLTHFFALFKSFQEKSVRHDRQIELIVVVDGELDDDLVRFRDKSADIAQQRAKLFAILCSREIVSKSSLSEQYAARIRKWCQDNADLLFEQAQNTTRNPERLAAAITGLSKLTSVAGADTGLHLLEAIDEILPSLDNFIASLRFESRVGHLVNEATFARLIESGDLSPEEARSACDRLKRSIQDESALMSPTVVDRSVLGEWLGVPKRTLLQQKPSHDPNSVDRLEFLRDFLNILGSDQFVLIHGLSKIGKSQFVSRLIDFDGRGGSYFWYTVLGDAGDLDRLARQLAVWLGGNTGKWQLIDDIERSGLQPIQTFERLGNSPVYPRYIVVDDCHKSGGTIAFEILRDLVRTSWQDSRLILISERRIPTATAAGAREVPFEGLTPQESILFASKLGVDLSDSMLQFYSLSLQVGGHPVMLRALVSELASKPSSEEVLALSQRIPSIASAEAFLNDLSNRIFFDLLKTGDQRSWLSRLAAVPFPVTKELALRLARSRPELQVSGADWTYVKSLLLDQIRADHYSIPALLQRIAEQSIPAPEKQAHSVMAARHVFQMATASRSIDLWDFQFAIFALLNCKYYDEAATRLVHSFPSLLRTSTFKPFELLFLTMNAEQTHANIRDAVICWFVLQFEVHFRIQAEDLPNWPRLNLLIQRMRGHLRNPAMPNGARAMLHVALASARMRKAKDAKSQSATSIRRVFTSINGALRAALVQGDLRLVSSMLHFYDLFRESITRPDVALFKDVVVQLPRGETLPVSGHTLVKVYSAYVGGLKHSDAAMRVVEDHAALFRAEGCNDAYLACEHAAALILHDGNKRYRDARNRLKPLVERKSDFNFSDQVIAHGLELIADTFWAESNYAKSAEYYRSVLSADLDSGVLHQIVCERLCDSLIFLRQYEKAARVALAELRSNRREQTPDQRAQLYGRLAYAYAECGALTKAAISCAAICRLASTSSSDGLDHIAATMSGWVLAHMSYSDSMIPKSVTQLRDSNALSESISPEDLNKWRAADPFKTRATVFTATLFELLEHWQRSGHYFRRAIADVLKSSPSADLYHETAFIYLARLARVYLKARKFVDASSAFRQSLDHVIRSRAFEKPQVEGSGPQAYSLLRMADSPLASCSDDEVARFFELLDAELEPDTSARAGICLRESEVLFERLAVQRAKERLQSGIELASKTTDYQLYWELLRNKHFIRAYQIYGRQEDWVRDALDLVAVLAGSANLEPFRQKFAEAVAGLTSEGQGIFSSVASVVRRLGAQWQENAFTVAAYALWRAAVDCHVISTSRAIVELILKKSGVKFLSASDFD